jgi:hypothetical protein
VNKKIIFFLEGTFHTQYIFPIIDKFDKDPNINSSVITLQKINNVNLKNTEIVTITKSELGKTLIELEADFFITTTPGIGSSYFPKSKIFPIKNRPKYVYVFHSLVSPNEVYFKKSFYNFDFILSPNQLITSQLKYLTSKKTRIITTGYPLFLNKTSSENFEGSDKNVLIAPSWGDQNFLTNLEFMEKLINYLKIKNLNIFIRPHIMANEHLDSDIYKGIKVDKSEVIPFNKYNYLFTDWSGVALEFFYHKNQKIFFVDSPKKIRRKLTKKELNLELIEYKIRDLIGEVISYDFNLDNLDLKNLNVIGNSYIDNLYTPEFQFQNFYNILDL